MTMFLTTTLHILMLWHALQLSDCKPATKQTVIKAGSLKVKPLPEPDGNLNVYALPVGQGDSHVIQCPDGTLSLYDMGTNEYNWDNPDPNSRFMTPEEIRAFFGTQQDRIQNIVITHNHYDHYVLLVRTFNQSGDIANIGNIYISCTEGDMAWRIDEWVQDMNLSQYLRTLNGGQPCGPNGGECDPVTLCPNDNDVTSWFMAANLGQHCSDGGNINMDSIVLKMERGGTSILMSGDFEDETSDWNEDGLQKLMADFYGETLQSTIFALSHHGASYLANKPVFREAVAPKSVFTSSNTGYDYRHPRCAVFDGLIDFVGSLCQPNAQEGDEFYCGAYPLEQIPPERRVQEYYTCGLASGDDTCPDQTCYRDGNEMAIYTTTPDENTIQLVQLSVAANGDWGFQTNLEIQIKK